METDKKYQKLLERVAENVSKIRETKGLVQEDMVRFGYSYRHYQRIESGKHSPNLFTLHRLSLTFKVDIKDFFR